MTISYSLDVANINISTIFRILFKWKGSVYKKLYQEFLIYAAAYFLISFIYRFGLNADQRTTFEQVSLFMASSLDLIPMAFILGFYVSIVFSRWQQIFTTIPWPDTTILTITTFMNENDNVSSSYRQALVRYLLAALIVVFRDVSAAVRKRFPTLQHIVEAGILRADELAMYESATHCNSHKYYVLIQWCLNILARCRSEQRIKSDPLLRDACTAVLNYRSGLGGILGFDWISVPLIYTQIVAMATWYYFLVCLLGRQYLDPSKGYSNHTLDIYVPPFTFLQFWFYMGWLKAAEGMLNPFGTDDDDFELNYIIERNFKVGISQAKELCGFFPILSAELEMETPEEAVIPHTEASLGQMDNAPVQSAENIVVPEKLARTVSQMPTDVASIQSRSPTQSPRTASVSLRKLSHMSEKMKNVFFRKPSTMRETSNSIGLGVDNPALRTSQNSLSPSVLEILGLGPEVTSQKSSTADSPEEAERAGHVGGSEDSGHLSPRLSTLRERSNEEEPPADDNAITKV